MFSKKCEYALRACIYLCFKRSEQVKVSIEEIAGFINSPIPFTAKILQELSKKKIISSVKGRNGGFFIDAKTKAITLDKIVTAIDGNDVFSRCCLGMEGCGKKKPCPMHAAWSPISIQTKELFHKTELSELTKDKKKLDLILRRS